MNITLHNDNCLGCGMCASLAPELFTMETGVVTFKKDPATWDSEDWKKAQDAAAACPNAVIDIQK